MNDDIESIIDICRVMLKKKGSSPTAEDVNNTLDKALLTNSELATNRGDILKILLSTYSIYSDNYKIIEDKAIFIEWLRYKKGDIRWYYWNRYLDHLRPKIAPDTLSKLDNLTNDILDRIGDPTLNGKLDRRGMVVGQVQSGKTNNYVGLINKATDAGYKFIIVLAGIQDSLRSQTQIRLDEGFIGFNSKLSLKYVNSNKIGVGFHNTYKDGQQINLSVHPLTSSKIDGDFRKTTATGLQLNLRGTDPMIVVVKKNGSILRNMITWLASHAEKDTEGRFIIKDVPLLLIDDEADNASINVDQKKVSSINASIRSLLTLFEKKAYVGYTATPFANIFIPLLDDNQYRELDDLVIRDSRFKIGPDLFPRDFIINIPAPSNYIGPSKVFGLPSSNREMDEEDIKPLPLTRSIVEYEPSIYKKEMDEDERTEALRHFFVPNGHKKEDTPPSKLSDSLKYAIKCFILATTARRARGQLSDHNSMLIHVTRYVNWQDKIATLVDIELKFYQQQIETNIEHFITELKNIWENEFDKTTKKIISIMTDDQFIVPVNWSEIKLQLHSTASSIEVRAVHGDKNIADLSHKNISPLDYTSARESGKFLNIIAVGGDKLSRGLTLEGLTISYYLRASKMYDTLMQMGRWFGYRPGYVDLCRIFTTDELIRWYKHITIASEELRKDFDKMYFLRKTPREFGFKIRTHPGVLKITAANKTRNVQKMYLSYSAELEQSYQLNINKKLIENNYKATVDLVKSLGATIGMQNSSGSIQKYLWRSKNNYNHILKFLGDYSLASEVSDLSKVADYIEAQIKNRSLITWTVVLIHNSRVKTESLHSFTPSIPVGLTDRSNLSTNPSLFEVSKFNITDSMHEALDLSQSEYDEAVKLTVADFLEDPDNKDKDVPKKPSRTRVRHVRPDEQGLLLIYPLNNMYLDGDARKQGEAVVRVKIADKPLIGIAISFPNIEDDEKVEFAVNEQFDKKFDYDDELDNEEEDDNE